MRKGKEEAKKKKRATKIAPSRLFVPLLRRERHSNASRKPSRCPLSLGSSTVRDAPKRTQLTIPPPKRRREIDAKGAEAAGSGGEGGGGGGDDDHGDARARDSRAASCRATCSVFDAAERSRAFEQIAVADSEAESAVPALDAAGEACEKKGHREAAAKELVVAAALDFIPTSGTTPPSPWKNE